MLLLLLLLLLAADSAVHSTHTPPLPDHPIVSSAEPLYLDQQRWFATHSPSSAAAPTTTPCLPRPESGAGAAGTPVNFTLANTIKDLCGDGHTPMDTLYSGRICDGREDIAWAQLRTINAPGPVVKKQPYCKNETWTSANAAAYTGRCGVAPWVAAAHTPGINLSRVVPVWLCSPAGFRRAVSGGSWANRSQHGNLSVEGCAAACRTAPDCKGFAVSDTEGCGLFRSALRLPFTLQPNTSTFVVNSPSPRSPPLPASRPVPATVPGDIITDLQREGLVGDPYFNETWRQPGFIAAWDNGTWTYSHNFTTGTEATQTLLVFDSIRMGAMIALNGHVLGNATNQFLRYIFPVGPLLKPAGGENSLTVTFGAELGIATGGRFSFASFGGFSPVMLTSVPTPADRSYPKRATFGFGIVKSVYVVPVPAVAITQFVPLTFYVGGHPTSMLSDDNHSGFEIRARVVVWAASATTGEFQVSLPTVPGASISVQAHLSAGESNVTLVLPAAATKSVRLWHPRNHGGQPLYNITASFVPSSSSAMTEGPSAHVAKATRRIGFRHVALVTVNESNTTASQGGTGTFTYFLRVNGAALFVRGANKVPIDLLEGRITASSHRQLVESAVEANMNTLRVWGGGVWEDRGLMEACDELGVLLYMDIMYTWNSILESVAVGSRELPATIRKELEHQIQRLSHHPSAVLWTGGNEIGMATDPGWGAHMGLVMPLVASLDSSRPIVPSSGPSAVGWVSGVDALSCRPNHDKLVAQPRTTIGVWPGYAFDQDSHGPYSFMMNPFRPSPLWAWISTDVMPVGLASQPREACSVGSCAAPHPCTEQANCTPTSVPARMGAGQPGFFKSETGAVSWSSFEAMRAQLPPDQWSMQSACGGTDPHACQLRNHRGDNLIQRYFGPEAGHPGTDTVGEKPFKRSLYRSMISALLMQKTNIESWRSQNVQGLLVWMLNDIWASGSWGALEYGGRFKPLHHQLRTTFADHLAVCNTAAACYVRNDAPFAASGTVTVRLLNVMTGVSTTMANISMSLGAGASAIRWFCGTAQVGASSNGLQRPLCVPWADAPGWRHTACSVGGSDCVLVVSLCVDSSPHRNPAWTNLQPFVAPMGMQLPDANVTAVVGRQTTPNRVDILLTASATSLYVVLTCSVRGRFTDNALMLESGRPRAVEFVGWAAELGTHDVASLRSSLRVEHLAQHVGEPLANVGAMASIASSLT